LALKELSFQGGNLFLQMINLFLDLVRFLLILYPAWAGLHRCNDVSRLEMVQVGVGCGQVGVA